MPGQQFAENVTGISKTGNDDIPGVRQLVGKQHLHNSQLYFALDLAVHHWIPPGIEYPQKVFISLFQNAKADQPTERLFANFTTPSGSTFHPKAGISRVLVLFNILERRVQQSIAGGCGIDQNQVFQVCVDTILQRQVHQYTACKCVAKRPIRHTCELAAIIVQQQKHNLFGKSQHGLWFQVLRFNKDIEYT